jgi:ankyrin repeat protein
VAERDVYAQQILSQSIKPPENSARPANVLQYALRNKTTAESSAIVEALQWVAFALRPLDQQEFFEALGTDLTFDIFPKNLHETNEQKHYGKEVLHHCGDLLRINENGAVDFHTAEIRAYVLSREFAELSARHAVDAHEMIGTVCIRHLQCYKLEAILKPWVSSRCWLTSTEMTCHLSNYSITFWSAHCRIAQCSSTHLSARLHQAIFTALAANDDPGSAEKLLPRTKINMALEMCSLHDLGFLGKTYLEMGADADGDSLSTTTPLTLAVANSSSGMVAVLLDAGANPNLLDRDGYSALGRACASGDLEIARLLFIRGADPNFGQRLSSSSEKSSWNGVCTPLLLAARYGHSDIVKLLLASESRSMSSALVDETNNESYYSPPPATTYSSPYIDLAAESYITAETVQQFGELSLLDTHDHYPYHLRSHGHNVNQNAEQDSWQLVERSDLDSMSTENSVCMNSAPAPY